MNYAGTGVPIYIEEFKANELIISNMISALNNPNIVQTLNDEELSQIYQAVRNHIVIMSSKVLSKQSVEINRMTQHHK